MYTLKFPVAFCSFVTKPFKIMTKIRKVFNKDTTHIGSLIHLPISKYCAHHWVLPMISISSLAENDSWNMVLIRGHTPKHSIVHCVSSPFPIYTIINKRYPELLLHSKLKKLEFISATFIGLTQVLCCRTESITRSLDILQFYHLE